VVGQEPVEIVQPVDIEFGPVEEVAQVEQVEQVAQGVQLELPAVQVALVVYSGLEEVAGLGEKQVKLQEEGEQRAAKVQSSHARTQGVCLVCQ